MKTPKHNIPPTIMHRQGDILFIQIEALPETALTQRHGHVIVAGEATGHAHRLAAGRILETVHGQLFLHVLQATQVVHEEHRAIALEPGYYQVMRQREYAPEALRTVID